MQLSIHTNDMLAVNNDYIIMSIKLLTIQKQLEYVKGEHQWSVNNFRSLKYGNWRLGCLVLCINNVLAACIGKYQSDTVTAPF